MTPTPARPEDGKSTAGQGTYAAFLAGKARVVHDAGPHCTPDDVHPSLFDFQRHITAWAVRKGRAAIWADTGLGKTRMQVEWCRLVGGRALILAPLAVAEQTVREAASIGVQAAYVRDQAEADVLAPGWIAVTNYDRLHLIDPAAYRSVVLDESSILKSFDGKTRTTLIQSFQATPYRLACTATPAPNDVAELANHAEFLSTSTRTEMLAAYFVHDDDGWRLKGHASEAMWRWVSTWAVACRKPSDLGFDDTGYDLPPLSILSELLAVDVVPDGQLFATDLGGIGGRAAVRRLTLDARVERAAGIVTGESDEPWLLWCGLNAEAERLAELIPGAVNVHGGMSPEDKTDALLGFSDGTIRVLITKPSIAGFGMNWQHCARMAFVGLSDSYEAYYQCIRRCYRFGQARPVHVHIVLSELESTIAANVAAKERGASRMHDSLVRHLARQMEPA